MSRESVVNKKQEQVKMSDLKALEELENGMVVKVTPSLDLTKLGHTGGSFQAVNLNRTRIGETNMMNTQRRTVTVELYDDDKGLPVDQSLVCRCSNVVTEDTDEVTIREVLMGGHIKGKLDAHNAKRVQVVNEEILNRTGQEVFLRPVKLKDLRWSVK